MSIVETAMQDSILNYAKHVHKNRDTVYVSQNKGPYVKEVESLLSSLMVESYRREQEMIEKLFSDYGGNPKKLPWA